jgi:phosphoribosylaminoimidazolecarboxamide formyltransferase/IMP cyclohydrolase
MKRALFSADDLTGIERFAASLKSMGWHLIATAETVGRLRDHGIEAEDVASFTGVSSTYRFPPTLHPKVEEALTTDSPARIDLVYDVPYPIEKGLDVGGHTLLALGAKGGRIVVFSPGDMEAVLEELKEDKDHRSITAELRTRLIDRAHAKIAAHYLSLARRRGESAYDGLAGERVLRLSGGENPYQTPSDLFSTDDGDALSLNRLESAGTGVPCFTNLADTDSILHTLSLAAEAFGKNRGKVPYIAVAAKHGNPCGVAVDWGSAAHTVTGALFGNPMAVWGGEFIVNFVVTEELAGLLFKDEERGKRFGSPHWMLDVIVAPGFEEGAVGVLGTNRNRKLLKNPALSGPGLTSPRWHYRQVRGGFLRQPAPGYVLELDETGSGGSALEDGTIDSLIVAWSVAYSSNHGGNEVALAKGGRLIGAGGGPSTVEAASTAVERAGGCGHATEGSVFAADAFFPFTDAPEVLTGAGSTGGVVPAGGKNEGLVREFFLKKNVRVVFLPESYRGFCRH